MNDWKNRAVPCSQANNHASVIFLQANGTCISFHWRGDLFIAISNRTEFAETITTKGKPEQTYFSYPDGIAWPK